VIHYLAESHDDRSIAMVERAGFHLVDIRMTLEWNAASGTLDDVIHNTSIRAHLPEDIPVLQDMARRNHYDTRFYCDRRYPRERADALYAEWVVRSCRESGGVLVALRGGEIAGYVTCDLDAERRGQIGLLGVDVNMRRSGIARLLVRGAQHWFIEHGAPTVQVVTQARNVGALRLYQRCGFLSSLVQLWYHRWLA
jgi:dTDP-4-amino-4,6-dideoxy-D-galactose acyltransferase